MTSADSAATTSATACSGCHRAFEPGTSILKDSTANPWHKECFKCSLCSTAIDSSYVVRNGAVICMGCANARRCTACGGSVGGAAVYKTVGDRHWHTDCFRCGSCNGSMGKGFNERGDKFFCNACAEKEESSAGQCGRCGRGIGNSGHFSALGKKWHTECFTCTKCATAFPNGSFFERNGEPLCSACNSGQ